MKYALGNMLNGAGGLNPDGLSLDLQFATDKTLTARKGPTPVFTRASTATFVGSNGLIQSAAINAPRFDHDPVTLSCKGLLIEESRTNLLTNSNFVGWTSGGIITVTPNSVDVGVAPDGSYPTKIECVVTGNLQLGIPVISGVTYNNSVYARSLSGGVTIRIGGIVSGFVSSFITTNLFARYSHTNTAAATTTRFLLIAMNAGETIYVWGAQAEAGAFPTSYIPTTTASVIRSADVCSITGSAFSGMYNQPEGTLFADVTPPTVAQGVSVLTVNTTTFNNSHSILKADSTASAPGLRWVGSTFTSGIVSNIITSTDVATTRARLAYAYKLNDMAFAASGSLVGTDTSGTMPSPTAMHIGMRDTAIQINGHLASIRYFKKRLANAKLQALTV